MFMKNAWNVKILFRKFEWERPLARTKCRQGDTIKMYFKERGCDMWIGFIWLRIGTSGVQL
jgi:hypothetical protein